MTKEGDYTGDGMAFGVHVEARGDRWAVVSNHRVARETYASPRTYATLAEANQHAVMRNRFERALLGRQFPVEVR